MASASSDDKVCASERTDSTRAGVDSHRVPKTSALVRTQNKLDFARAQAADRRCPLRKATHAAVSSVSAAIENDVGCGSGARKAWCGEGAGGRGRWQAACVAAPDVVPQSTSTSASSARAGMCRRSVACVRSAGMRGRGGMQDSKASSNKGGSEASVARL
eukprot:2772094-Pleurochrysis_carterae.AAC.2